MQRVFEPELLNRITFLVGAKKDLEAMDYVPPKRPFDQGIVGFLSDVSKRIMVNPRAKEHPDVITFAFWIRRSSLNQLKERFAGTDGTIRVGRGTAFHIAPSNVPVNFAYSLVSGLLSGNANVVRVPSKDFEQVSIIAAAIRDALDDHSELRPYVVLVRYDRDRNCNDLFSDMADTRIVWGGDETIAELRKSPLQPRSLEITFADRYSMAVIDSDAYMEIEDKKRVALDFYNDTYLSDQNACTSPRIVIWTGGRIDEAKDRFWQETYKVVKEKYEFQSIQAVNKLSSAYIIAAQIPGCIIEPALDNLITRIRVPEVSATLMRYKDNSGFFFEYHCNDIMELRGICSDTKCQTISYIGNPEMFRPLLDSEIKGVDRIVPIGRSMDFDLIWDGYNLIDALTRVVVIS